MKKLDYDIVMLALPRWDGLYSSTAYSLARAMSKYTRVFYIDNPFTFKDYLSRRNSPQLLRRKRALLDGQDQFTVPDPAFPNLVAVTPKLVLPINWMSAGAIYDTFSKQNDRIVFKTIEALLQEYDVKRFVFINSFNPLFGRFFSWTRYKPALTIYHCVDDISKSEYISKHGTRLESEAVKKADLTLTTSMELKRLKEKDSFNVYYHPNAANVELFQQTLTKVFDKPAEMNKVPEGRKIILYMGNICHRLDYELLKKIALRDKETYLVMVGPQSNDNYRKAGLHELGNVIFTGTKKLEELPAYVQYSDLCIIPFLCNTLTKSIYPLKINEYLSAGKPVITTNFSEDIANFGEIAYVSHNHDEFLSNIEKGLQNDSKEQAMKRMAFASGNNWDARAGQLVDIIEKNIR